MYYNNTLTYNVITMYLFDKVLIQQEIWKS
jgi:hypothetical protein